RPLVYRVVRLVNATPLPFLAGSVAIQGPGGRVGQVQLQRVPSGAPFELTLGVDPGLRIARTGRQEAERSGQRLTYGYAFVATNPGTRSVQVEISDRIPVSEVEEIEVHLDDGTTPGYGLARDDGVLRWKVEVPPGKSSTVELRYHLDVRGEVD